MLTRRYGYLLLAIFLVISGPVRALEFETVVEKARELSQQPYQAPASIPKFLQDVSFTQYQGIRFKPEKSLWCDLHGRFQVMLVPTGLVYTHAVKRNLSEGGAVRALPYSKDYFSFELGDNGALEKKIPADAGFAGFNLTFPFKSRDVQNQFLVFAGASYFRRVASRSTRACRPASNSHRSSSIGWSDRMSPRKA